MSQDRAWIGVRELHNGLFPRAAMACPDGQDDAPLLRGTVRVEYLYEPFEKPRNILRLSRRDPDPFSMTFRSDPDGMVGLMMRQGPDDAAHAVRLPLPEPGERVVLQYAWDVEAGRGYLSADLPERGKTRIVTLDEPLALTWRCVRQLMHRTLGPAEAGPGLIGVALSDRVQPAGPQAEIDGAGVVSTPEGPVRIDQLRAGQTILAADESEARILWVGSGQTVLRGPAAACLIRAPYLGLTSDLSVSGTARARLRGIEVEYLFGEPEVAVSVYHLADAVAVIGPPRGSVPPAFCRRLWHLVPDRAVPVRVSGTMIEPVDLSDIVSQPGLHAASLLAGVSRARLAAVRSHPVQRLRSYEARTLRQMQAA